MDVTIRPNDLVATVHPSRMPVMLVDGDALATWLECGEADAQKLIAPYPANQMTLVPRGSDRADPLASSIVS